MKNKRIIIFFGVAAVLLLIPLVVAQFSREVNWSGFDFAVMGILLAAVAISCELVLRRVKNTTPRILLCAAVLLTFLLIWAELAVGIFGTPFAGY